MKFSFIKEGSRMSFISQWDAQYLQCFVCTSIQLYIVLNDCHQAVSGYCSIYLYSNSVLCNILKYFDFKVLLEPFWKLLYLPAIFIKFGNLKSRYMRGIGYENEFPFLFFIPIFNQSKWLWIILFRIESNQKYTCAWKHILV